MRRVFYSHISIEFWGIQEMPIVFVGALLVQDPLKLRREIDDWMANYDERQEEKKRLARETQVGIPFVCQRYDPEKLRYNRT